MGASVELEAAIQETGQRVVDFEPLESARLAAAIDAHLANRQEKCAGGNVWQAGRIKLQAVRGSFGHMACTGAIMNGPKIDGVPPDAGGLVALGMIQFALMPRLARSWRPK